MANEDFIPIEENIHNPMMKTGRGQKRSIDEVNDGVRTSNKVSDNNYYFTMNDFKQVRVEKFRTTGVDYKFKFTDTFANLELSQYHNRLRGIFESLLNSAMQGIPQHDQVRFVLRSPTKLEWPISLPFMRRKQLTTERVVAEIERVIQSK